MPCSRVYKGLMCRRLFQRRAGSLISVHHIYTVIGFQAAASFESASGVSAARLDLDADEKALAISSKVLFFVSGTKK